MQTAEPLAIDFAQEKEAGYQRVFSRLPLLTSLEAGWTNAYFAYDYMPPGETIEVVAPQHGVAIFTNFTAPAQVERKIDGRLRHEQTQEGDIVITPAHVSASARWNVAGGVIFIGFEPGVFARAIDESLELDQLTPQFSTPAPLVHQIGLALKTVLEREATGSRLYAETLLNAMIMHLIQQYGTRSLKLNDVEGGLPRRKLRAVIDYIQAHLNQDLGIDELAQLVQLSPHYFSRLFKQSTGFTPHQFVIRARIDRAKLLLIRGNTIADAANQVGFADQSHLNRHFKRLLGITPKDILNR